MAALIAAQTEVGWVSPEVIAVVAQILEMPTIAVEEVATFYNMYNTKPIGKYKLVICTNLPCQLTHGETAATYLKETLGIGVISGLFTLARQAEIFKTRDCRRHARLCRHAQRGFGGNQFAPFIIAENPAIGGLALYSHLNGSVQFGLFAQAQRHRINRGDV